MLKDIIPGQDFQERPPTGQEIVIFDKWDHTKLKSFCTDKEIINRMMRRTIGWGI